MDDPLLQRCETIFQQADIGPSSGLLLGVSGGIDSMALFHAVRLLAPVMGYRFAVYHLNHGLRGEESDGDEAFVRSLCDRYQIVCETLRRRFSPPGVQRQAREERLSLSRELARQHRCTHICTGHHADDQVETFFLTLFRGAGPAGLGGMSVYTPPFFKPLLPFRRKELHDFINRVGEGRYREDSSNRKTYYRRNKVRLELLPRLRREYRLADHALCRQMTALRLSAEYLRGEARRRLDDAEQVRIGDRCLAVDRAFLEGVETGLLFYVLSEMARRVSGGERCAPPPALLPETAGTFHLPPRLYYSDGEETDDHYGGLVIELTPQRLWLAYRLRKKISWHRCNDEAVAEGGRFRVSVGGKTGGEARFSLGVTDDRRAAVFQAAVTSRKFRPLGAPGRKTIGRILIDRKVPRFLRPLVTEVRLNGTTAVVWGIEPESGAEFLPPIIAESCRGQSDRLRMRFFVFRF